MTATARIVPSRDACPNCGAVLGTNEHYGCNSCAVYAQSYRRIKRRLDEVAMKHGRRIDAAFAREANQVMKEEVAAIIATKLGGKDD